MKYFFDTEFIEGFRKPVRWLPTILNFNKPIWTIQLISIGIVCEDGRKYYAISNEFNPKDANDWVKENVIAKLGKDEHSFLHEGKINWLGKFKTKPLTVRRSNKQIANQIISFTSVDKPQFYAYHADYDWVVFCSNLFGSMMNLPQDFPQYCVDLKQILDEKVREKVTLSCKISINKDEKRKLLQLNADSINAGDYREALAAIKMDDGYPKQDNEHNALDDAEWNFNLYKFINTLF